MRFLKTDRLYCFSPPIMLATFFIEIGCVLYVLWRYKLTPVSRLATVILIGLAIFQFAEYNICEGALGVDSLTWARIGYVAITLLPPLGLHLVTVIARQKRPRLTGAAYVSGGIFSAIFLFAGHGITGQTCLGNYVIFDIAQWAIWPYVIYYYGWLLVTVYYAGRMAAQQKSVALKSALVALSMGYLAFIIPTTAVTVIDPATVAGIPSIMCGFAAILAVILTFKVVPSAHSYKKYSKLSRYGKKG